jgi:hypothetical protein
MTEKVDAGERVVYFYIIFIVIFVFFVFLLLYYIILVILPKILTTELPNLPLNSNSVYPILLQGLIIMAGVILGLFGTVFFETISKISSSIEKNNIGLSIRAIFYIIVAALGLFSIVFALLSIFYSINAMINYGIVKTYITTQINANVIHTISTNGTVILINASYINHTITPNTIAANSIKSLSGSSKSAITYLFYGFTTLVLFIAIYLSAAFRLIDFVKKFIESNLANYLSVAFIVFAILSFVSFLVIPAYSLGLDVGIGFLVLAFIVLLNQPFKNLFKYFKNLFKKRKDSDK